MIQSGTGSCDVDHRCIEFEVFEPSGEEAPQIDMVLLPPPPFIETEYSKAVDDLSADLVLRS